MKTLKGQPRYFRLSKYHDERLERVKNELGISISDLATTGVVKELNKLYKDNPRLNK